MEERIKRMNDINKLIKVIGQNDKKSHHKFFHSKNEEGKFIPGHFVFDANGLLYYIDPYSKAKIRPIQSAHAQKQLFNGGGNMWEILKDFGRFIMYGEKGFLRDYKEIWAFEYEETMNVRAFAKEIGFIEHIDYPHVRFA